MSLNTVAVMVHQKLGSSGLQVELHCEEYVVLLAGQNRHHLGEHITPNNFLAKHHRLSTGQFLMNY